MAEQQAVQINDELDTAVAARIDPREADIADAVDARAAQLTGSAAIDAPIAEINGDPVEAAVEHLDDANLDDDRETLKWLQQTM